MPTDRATILPALGRDQFGLDQGNRSQAQNDAAETLTRDTRRVRKLCTARSAVRIAIAIVNRQSQSPIEIHQIAHPQCRNRQSNAAIVNPPDRQ
jgi:hypothetical protein